MGEIIRRPDLEAQEVSFPDYIADKVFPWFGRPQIAGELYYQKYNADPVVQYNRNTANLADISENIRKAHSVTFSCKEVRDRETMGYTELKGYRDKEYADLYLGRLAKRGWFDKVELLVADTLLNPSSAPVDGTADIVGTLDREITKIRDLGVGEVCLVLSNHNKVALKNNQTIIERMKMTGVPTGTFSDIRSVSDVQLAAALGCDWIYTGKDDIWYRGLSGADKDNVGIIVRAAEEIDPAERVMLGRLVYFEWEDSEADKFVMESWHDNRRDAEVVDAKGLVDLKILNPELCTVVRGWNDNSDSGSGSGSESI